jgi:hypothetical protein
MEGCPNPESMTGPGKQEWWSIEKLYEAETAALTQLAQARMSERAPPVK